MKLRLPKALMTAMAAVAVAAAPLATTVATGVFAVAAVGQTQAADIVIDLTGNVEQTVKPTASVDDGGKGMVAGDNLTVNIAGGSTVDWKGSAQVNVWANSVVNVGDGTTGAVLNVWTDSTEFGVFNQGSNSTIASNPTDAGSQTINVMAGSTLNTKNTLSGWLHDNKDAGATIVNLSTGSAWNVQTSTEFVNQTDINVNDGTLNLGDATLQFERPNQYPNRHNSINTTAAATGMGRVVSDTGVIKLNNVNVRFDVVHGNWTYTDTDYADLLVDVAINQGAYAHSVNKTGDGILVFTKANGYTDGTNVKDGTLRLIESGTVGGAVTLGATEDGVTTHGTLELAHASGTEAAPTTTANAITFNTANSVLSVKGAYEKTTGAISGAGTISVAAGAHYTATGAITNASLSVAGDATLTGALSGTGTISVANGGALAIGGSYALAQGSITTTGTGSVAFGENASINVAGWTAATALDTATQNGFLTDSYTFFTNGANISIADGGITLMSGATNLGKATLTVSEGTGTLELGKYVYNIASGTVNYSTIHGATETLQRVQVQSGGTLSIDGTATEQRLSPALCEVTGTGTVELAWTGRVTDNETFNNGLNSFDGDVVVKSGTSVILAGSQHSFHSLTAEAGGQLAINRAYTGDVTIAGTGLAAAGNDTCGALKLGSNITLTGNVTLKGDSVAISTWGGEAGTIAGNINAENAHTDLHFWNGNGSGNNSLTVTGTISKVDYIEVERGTLTVNNGIDGTGETSIIKAGAGTLVLHAANETFINALTINEGRVEFNGTSTLTSSTGKMTYTGTNAGSGRWVSNSNRGDSLGGKDLVMKGTVTYHGEFEVAAGV